MRPAYLALIAAVGVSATISLSAMGSTDPQTAGPGNTGTSAPIVAVSILPQAYFVERIAGTRVKPMVLVGPGQSPHAYEPTPRQMADLASAPLWLTIGADFEKALRPKIASLYPKLSIVDTTAGIKYRQLEAHNHEGEPVEAGHAEESGPDQHVWLGRQAVIAMAGSIRDALSRYDPAGASTYANNHDAFVKDINAVYDSLKAKLAPLEGKPVFVYHPAFGYFFDEYGIEQEAVETGGKEPTQKALAGLIKEARDDGAKVIFVQAQFPASAAESVAKSIGGVVVSIDPLAPDWLENIKRIGTALTKAVR
jgi:zinc transport system substrate-binding protein